MKTVKYLLVIALFCVNTAYAQEDEGFFSKVKGAVKATVSDAKGNFWLDLANKQYLEEKDYTSALKNYARAAARDMAQADYMLYIMYRDGEGTKKDKVTAMQHLQKAVAANYAPAQVSLAFEKLENPKSKKDNDESIKLLQKAAKQDDIIACITLYNFYSDGVIVKKDGKKATEYARMANALGAKIDVGGASQPADKDVLRQIQANLKLLGYYQGSIDGIYGPMTKKAIIDFQKAKGLKQTGQSSKELLIQTQKAL